MNNNLQTNVRYMTRLALLGGIMVLMAFTPLGYIPLGFMNATTMHIPVIIGGCILGVKAGAILGGLFGITSVIKATIQPNITSFVFTPFYSLNPQFHGSWTSLVVAIVPRILIGVVAALVFKALLKVLKNQSVSLLAAGFLGSITNTIGVMGLIWLLFGEQYAMASEASAPLYLVILGVVGTNGVPEAIVAAIITAAVGKALLILLRKRDGQPAVRQ